MCQFPLPNTEILTVRSGFSDDTVAGSEFEAHRSEAADDYYED